MRTLLWLLIAVAGLSPLNGADLPPPHIVLFLADDLGWADCAIYGGTMPTPNMTRVAKDGMTFNQAFVASPSCAPSRAALLTGLHCARNGAMFNHSKPRAEIKKWPAYFQELGYEVAAIGKTAHYAQVKDYGFDHASHFTYHADTCIDAACAWLEARDSAKPLCLLVGTNWPHVPWPATGGSEPPLPAHLVNTAKTRAAHAQYAAAVAKADHDLGQVYDAVRRKLGANLLFLFTSDHGAQWPFGKWNCYDSGVRTPLVVVWPGKVAAGSRTDAMVSWIDLLPTCLNAAPLQTVPAFDGRSFMPVLLGKSDHHRDLIFTTHSGDGQMNDYPIRAVRSPEWKYLRNLAPDRDHHTHIDLANPEEYWNSWVEQAKADPATAATVQRYHRRPAEELYHLTADPGETRNLASDPSHRQTLDDLRLRLDEWMRSQGDQGLVTENLVRPKAKSRK